MFWLTVLHYVFVHLQTCGGLLISKFGHSVLNDIKLCFGVHLTLVHSIRDIVSYPRLDNKKDANSCLNVYFIFYKHHLYTSFCSS